MIISPDPEFADDKTFLNLFMGRYFWLEIACNEWSQEKTIHCVSKKIQVNACNQLWNLHPYIEVFK